MIDTKTKDTQNKLKSPFSKFKIDIRESGYSGIAFLSFEILIFVCMGALILWQNGVTNIFSNSTATGGDVGAHIWGPDFIKEHLFPGLSGWTNDWFGGLPAYTFYPIVPNYVAAALSFLFNDNVAFKLVTVAGLLAIPPGAYYLGKTSGLKRPIPIFMALFSLIFIYDDNHTIYGLNVLANLAGEYSETWGFAFSLFYLGTLMKGLRENRLKVWIGVLLALTVLSHPLVGLFTIIVTFCVLITSPNYKTFKWLAWVFGLGCLLSSFWVIPFLLRREYTTTIGWRKDSVYGQWLFRGGDFGHDFWWIFTLAFAAAIVSHVYKIRLGKVLSYTSLILILVFRFLNTGFFLVNRIVPLYYASIVLLAAMGMGLFIKSFWVYKTNSLQLSDGNKLFLKIAAGIVYGFGSLIVLLRYIPGDVGARITRAILDNSSSLASSFFNQVFVLFLVGAGGFTLALLIIFMPDIVRKIKFSEIISQQRHDGEVRRSKEFKPSKPFKLSKINKYIEYRRLALLVSSFVLSIGILYSVGLQLRLTGWEEDGRFGVHIPGVERITTTEARRSLSVPWAAWNYSGFEGKTGTQSGPGWSEFSGIIQTMNQVGEERGCGRALLEYQNDRQTSYGTSFSRNTLPYWTDGCITAIDGLYTESSATSPFYYITLTEVAEQSSEIIGGLSYVNRSLGEVELFSRGIQHLQILGVNYYIAGTRKTINLANVHPDLELIAIYPDEEAAITELAERYDPGLEPHHVYLVQDSNLIVPLLNEPAIIGSRNWLEKSNEWWINPERLDVVLLADGPEQYQELTFDNNIKFPDVEPSRNRLAPVVVSDIRVQDEKISFRVDEVGVPVLVKVSYFPNWSVSGAKGPYRASPNWMVVIPTENEVVLNYGFTSVEYLGYGMSGLGVTLALGTYIWDRKQRKKKALLIKNDSQA